MKSQKVKYGDSVCVATLKGMALSAAVSAGMIPRAKTADGYNIAPFLKFWDEFSPALAQAFEQVKEQRQTVRNQSNYGSDQ